MQKRSSNATTLSWGLVVRYAAHAKFLKPKKTKQLHNKTTEEVEFIVTSCHLNTFRPNFYSRPNLVFVGTLSLQASS